MSIGDVQRVSNRFGPVIAVDKVSFEVNVGELIGLLSRNGAGKTTIFRLVLDIFQVKRFEITTPTLYEIFFQVVQEPTKNQ